MRTECSKGAVGEEPTALLRSGRNAWLTMEGRRVYNSMKRAVDVANCRLPSLTSIVKKAAQPQARRLFSCLNYFRYASKVTMNVARAIPMDSFSNRVIGLTTLRRGKPTVINCPYAV